MNLSPDISLLVPLIQNKMLDRIKACEIIASSMGMYAGCLSYFAYTACIWPIYIKRL